MHQRHITFDAHSPHEALNNLKQHLADLIKMSLVL
jgi:hypothetical protein